MYRSRATTNIPFSLNALQWSLATCAEKSGNIYTDLRSFKHALGFSGAVFLAVSAVSAVSESTEGGRPVGLFNMNITRRAVSAVLRFGVVL